MDARTLTIDLVGGGKLPAIGLGTWQAKDEVVEKTVEKAIELGYRHIDTALVYENEAAIGRALKRLFAAGKVKRGDLFVTTKLPMYGVHPDRVEMFMKRSLERLQLDHVDLYLIHLPIAFKYFEGTQSGRNEKGSLEMEDETRLEEVWAKMEAQVDAGRAKAIGISNFNVQQTERVLRVARIKPAANQIEHHVFLQQPELVDFCGKNGVAVVAYSPLANPSYNKFLEGFGMKGKELPDILHNAVVEKIAKKHNKTPAQICLRYVVQRGLAAIPKTTTPSRLEENISIFDFALDDEDLKALKALDLGPKARVCDMKLIPNIDKHPDYPFK